MATATREPETVVETAFEPVEYWNAVRPNEVLIARRPGPKDRDYDAAADPSVTFFAGYFRATEPWQVELIDTYAGDRAFRADISPSQEPIRCDKCGWETRSSQAFRHHVAQES
jgi:hypothetical protein